MARHRPSFAILLCTAMALECNSCTESVGSDALRFQVTRGSFSHIIEESAELRADSVYVLQNELPGTRRLLYLIGEGSTVKKGDRLAELDASDLIEKRTAQEIAVEKAKAATVRAATNLEILTKQVRSDRERAKNARALAELDHQKFHGKKSSDGTRGLGEREHDLQVAKAAVDLAERELKLASDETTAGRLRSKLERARNRLSLLQTYTHPRMEMKLEQASRQAALDQQLAETRGEAKITMARADLREMEAASKAAQRRLDVLTGQIAAAVILAPAPGIVVYATEGDRFRPRTVAPGSETRERQDLVIIPDLTTMHAWMTVPHSDAGRIRPGMPARITLDGSRTPLTGSVRSIGNAVHTHGVDPTESTVLVDFTNADEAVALRPNTSALVEIETQVLKEVISIPLQAVQSHRGVSYVWLRRNGRAEATVVRLGVHDATRVVVERGLEAGQEVYLSGCEQLTKPTFGAANENAK